MIRIFFLSAFLLIHSTFLSNNKITYDTLDTRELIKTKNGVKLYERWFEKENYGKIREISLEFTVNAPIKNVTSLIKKGEKIKDWNKNVKESEAIEVKQFTWFTYIKYGIPWPFDDQDCLLINTLIIDKANHSVVIVFKSSEHINKPVIDSIERMEDVNGKWELKALPEGKTFVRYTISSRPSKVPTWITDPFVRKAFLDAMSEFSNLAEKL
jgi:hypothetical protein